MFYVNGHSSRGTLNVNAEKQASGLDEQMPYEPAVVGTLSYRDVNGDIFAAGLPQIQDVNQRRMGNCSLLSTIISILSLRDANGVLIGPNLIEGMMHDEGANGVVVRLYDPNRVNVEPRFYRIKKSIIHSWLPNAVYHGGTVWLALLEKAVATSLRSSAHGSHTYKVLEPGPTPDKLFRMLLGITRASSQDISARPQNEKVEFLNRILSGNLADFDVPTLNSIFRTNGGGAGLANLNTWHSMVRHGGRKWLEASSVKRHAVLRIEDVEAFLQRNNKGILWESTQSDILNWIERDGVLPGKRGTFKYSQDQIALFERISLHLRNNQPVTAGSNPAGVGRAKSINPFARPEVLSKGLASTHMYAVLGVTAQPAGGKFLRLRNPWGQQDPKLAYGRGYTESQPGGPLQAKAIHQSEFDLELSDFTKRFVKVFFGGEAVALG